MALVSGGSGGGVSIPAATTTLPGSPTNGLLAVLTDSTTAPTYQWLLEYDTTITGTYKWRFLGGQALINEVAGANSMGNVTGTVFASFGTATPTVTLPNAGVWLIDWGCTIYCSAAAVYFAQVAPKFGASAVATNDMVRTGGAGQNIVFAAARKYTRTISAASTQVVLQGSCSSGAGNTITAENGWLACTPVLLT